ncbi:hypothetical protein N7468_002743 [Penicillium chermesinum]|uniref:Uncharacterized protein n=1 Tax=Penicillium chermesinum TaxID=63820 RepID=A0A9W9PJ59_9EURO|nr:uncharacterized protein N7468_002743 [Penicillium chermesinum]KAJ5247760.1 hypothetical protein N7468_002743 [Penicillium chermesinum]
MASTRIPQEPVMAAGSTEALSPTRSAGHDGVKAPQTKPRHLQHGARAPAVATGSPANCYAKQDRARRHVDGWPPLVLQYEAFPMGSC